MIVWSYRPIRRARSIVTVAIVFSLAACGGGDDGPGQASNPPAPPPTSANRAPAISGTPPTSAMQGTSYQFIPTANDADGDSLVFSIVNRPSWAGFDAQTGRLSGTPTQADVGNYANIRISVSDGQATTSLPPFSISVVGTATGAVTLSWTPPTQRTDGTVLNNLAGYRIRWGTSAGNYTQSATVGSNVASHVISDLTPATWYFVATAFDAAGNESQYSNVASKTITP